MTTMMWPMRRAATVAAERIATTCGATSLTYAETAARCRHLAAGLRTPRPRARRSGRRPRPQLPPLRRAVPDRPGRRDGAGPAEPAPHRRRAALRPRRRRRDRPVRRAAGRRPPAVRAPRHRPRRGLRSAAGRRGRPARRRRVATRGRRRHARRPLLHRRHDGGVEGRDAVARQPRRQRLPPPGGVPLRGRDPLADRRPAVPRRRFDRRAGDGVARRPPRRAPGVRPRSPPSTSSPRSRSRPRCSCPRCWRR